MIRFSDEERKSMIEKLKLENEEILKLERSATSYKNKSMFSIQKLENSKSGRRRSWMLTD